MRLQGVARRHCQKEINQCNEYNITLYWKLTMRQEKTYLT